MRVRTIRDTRCQGGVSWPAKRHCRRRFRGCSTERPSGTRRRGIGRRRRAAELRRATRRGRRGDPGAHRLGHRRRRSRRDLGAQHRGMGDHLVGRAPRRRRRRHPEHSIQGQRSGVRAAAIRGSAAVHGDRLPRRPTTSSCWAIATQFPRVEEIVVLRGPDRPGTTSFKEFLARAEACRAGPRPRRELPASAAMTSATSSSHRERRGRPRVRC